MAYDTRLVPMANDLRSPASRNEATRAKGGQATCLGFYLIVQELLFELGQGVVGAVIVQVQWVEDIPEGEKQQPVAHWSSLLRQADYIRSGNGKIWVKGASSKTGKENLSALCVPSLHLGMTYFTIRPQKSKLHDANKPRA